MQPNWYYELPFGLGYISAVLQHAGYEGVYLNTNEITKQELILRFREIVRETDVLLTGGLSVEFSDVRNIIRTAKNIKPEIVTIIGGGLVTAEPELVMNATGADIGVIGEGEDTIVRILREVEDRTWGGKPTLYKSTKDVDMESLPIPDYDSMMGGPGYLDKLKPSDTTYSYPYDNPRALGVISSRGCPFQCTFCFSPTGRKHRIRSLDKVFMEIEYLISKYNINLLNLYDEVLALKDERLQEFCKGIKKYNIKWGCQLRVNGLTKDKIALLKDSNCYVISLGIENINPEILKSMKKGITIEQIENALEWAYDLDIDITGNILLGDIAETGGNSTTFL